MKQPLLILLLLLSSFLAIGQNTISGKVTDLQGEGLPGVNVMIVGSSAGTVTDIDGNFSLAADPEDILRFSFIGYKAYEVVVGNTTSLNVQLEEDIAALDEIVVVGYGTQRKSNVVGSVTSVEVDDATTVPTTNVSEMLRGRAAGVQVNLGDARPGGDSEIIIRGMVSVAPNGNSPFIVVDGVPYDNLNDVPADNIASIEIL